MSPASAAASEAAADDADPKGGFQRTEDDEDGGEEEEDDEDGRPERLFPRMSERRYAVFPHKRDGKNRGWRKKIHPRDLFRECRVVVGNIATDSITILLLLFSVQFYALCHRHARQMVPETLSVSDAATPSKTSARHAKKKKVARCTLFYSPKRPVLLLANSNFEA